MEYPTMYHAALAYINMGLAVFPLEERGKRPLTKNGCKDATTDAAKVKAWWQQNPNANIGIATGTKSGGIFVVDLDVDEDRGIDGYHSLQDWQRENGEFPDTWTAITGRGGYHLYYKWTAEQRNRAGIIDGVDIRGEGGYVVAPPSVHNNGREYEWEIAPDEMALAKADNNVEFFLNGEAKQQGEHFVIPSKIAQGSRNDMLFRFACMLQAKGVSDETVFVATLSENKMKCTPPLPEAEVRIIVSSVLRYEKGKPITFNADGLATQDRRDPIFATDENGKIKQTIANMCEAIEYDGNLWGRIKYNVLSYSPFVVGELPWESTNMYREWTNADDSNLKSYIEKRYGFTNMDKIMEALNIVTNRNKFNPVVDMLEQKHRDWDGKFGHIRMLLPSYLGVEDTEYTYEVMKLFMLGAISRAFKLGCKFDYMPVVLGDQGIGKSTYFRYLSGNNSWYNDNFNTVEGDKAPEKLRGMWMVEMAELLATKKAKEIESIKAFLTSTVDTYRPPYGRRTEQRPRCCVFAGTTNNSHFLTDRTGNRRFLPLVARADHIKKSLFGDAKEIQEDFSQAWGEAMELYKKAECNPKLILPKHLQAYAKERQEEFIEEDARVGIIQEWLNNTKEERVCTAMIYAEALKIEKTLSRYESNELHTIMENMKGWKKLENKSSGRARCGKYGVQICYVRDNEGFVEIDENEKLPFEI